MSPRSLSRRRHAVLVRTSRHPASSVLSHSVSARGNGEYSQIKTSDKAAKRGFSLPAGNRLRQNVCGDHLLNNWVQYCAYHEPHDPVRCGLGVRRKTVSGCAEQFLLRSRSGHVCPSAVERLLLDVGK